MAIAIAYAGGWLWTALVTLAAIGLYVEWLMVVGEAREMRVVASGVVALAVAGLCLGIRADRCCRWWRWRSGLAAVALLSRGSAAGPRPDLSMPPRRKIASVLVRLDPATDLSR